MDQKQKVEGGLLGLLILVLFIGGYFWYTSTKIYVAPTLISAPAPIVNSAPVSDVVVNQSSQSTSTSALNLPTGFPNTIPVELSNIFESYNTEYRNAGYVQYTVGYTSQKTVVQKWKEYSDFMIKDGFQLKKEESVQAQGTLYGEKGGQELSVLVSVQNKQTTVHIMVVQKK